MNDAFGILKMPIIKINRRWPMRGRVLVSCMMNKNVKELKSKKEILMATFQRHLKRKQDSIRSGAGADDVYKPIWYAYDIMESFLGPVYTCTKSKNTEKEAPSQETTDETAVIEDEEGEDNNLVQPSTSFHTPTPVTSRRRPATDLAERQMSSAFGQLTNILTKRQKEQPTQPKEDDDCDLFAKLLAKKLRELPYDDRQLLMYDIDTLFINRIKENINRHQTLSSHYSVPYQMYSVPHASPISNRPSSSKSSYSEPLPNRSPLSNRPSSSKTSYSEPLTNRSQFSNRPSSSQLYFETLPSASPSSNQPSISQTSHCEPLPFESPPPTIQIISNELIGPRTGQNNILNEALIKAYEDFEYREN